MKYILNKIYDVKVPLGYLEMELVDIEGDIVTFRKEQEKKVTTVSFRDKDLKNKQGVYNDCK